MILTIFLTFDFKLVDLDDNIKFLSELYQEKAVFVSFWATWCKPCKKELKYVQEFFEKYNDSIYVITITVDDIKKKDKIRSFLISKNYTFPVFFDIEKEILRSLGISNIPLTLIFDMEGNISYKHIGFKKGDEIEIEEEIKKVIERSKSEKD